MMNHERRTKTHGALRAIKILPSARNGFPFSVQFLRCNETNTSAFTSILPTTRLLTFSTRWRQRRRRWYPRHYLQQREGCLRQWRARVTLWKHLQRAMAVGWRPGCIRYIQMCVSLATYIPCKCTLVRDARRAIPLRVATGDYRCRLSFTSHLFGVTQIREQKFPSISLIPER